MTISKNFETVNVSENLKTALQQLKAGLEVMQRLSIDSSP
jgi:hypothetical protein